MRSFAIEGNKMGKVLESNVEHCLPTLWFIRTSSPLETARRKQSKGNEPQSRVAP